MKFTRLHRILLLFAAASMLCVHLKAEVIVIVNPSVKSDSASQRDLRDIFTGASSKLKDGSHVKPVLLKEGPTHMEFIQGTLKESVVTVITSWRRLVFAGQATMPKEFESETAEVDFVARTPGAIGYIRSSTPHEAVKVLKVE